jgi:hypothetical protein
MNEPLPVAEAMKQRAAANPKPARRTRSHPRARPYLRLLLAIPGLALLAIGLYYYNDIEDNGYVDTIKLTTKPGLVGQVSESVRLVEPGNPDLYLKITIAGQKAPAQTKTYKDMPVGNGLQWPLDKPILMSDLKQVDVWDENTFKDKQLDHITLGGWSAEGQTFRIDLLGRKFEPPKWAMPIAAVGGTIVLLVFLRFVWDQVI